MPWLCSLLGGYAFARLLRELDHLGPVDADRFAREYATQLVVERIVSQLVDLAASVNAHVVAVEAGAISPMLQLGSVVMALVTTAMTGPLFDKAIVKADEAAVPETVAS